MDFLRARNDLTLIEELLRKTRLRLDPHAFHFVHWGFIVLLWFPIGNVLELQDRTSALVTLNVCSVVLGIAITIAREMHLAREPRIVAEDTFLTRQVVLVVYSVVIATTTLSAIAPATGLIDGANVPILWGLGYATIAFMTGVVYERDFLWSGIAIFAGCVLAIFLQQWNGFILGPFMGLGMIVPGIRAERRVRRFLKEDELVRRPEPV